MAKVSPRLVVGIFAATRVAVGVAFALAPDRLSTESNGTRSDTLMTRSFAVREVVLGVGGLVAVASTDRHPSAVRSWAGVGALTDAGDLAAALAGGPRRNHATRIPALVAAMGLAAELWAFAAPVHDRMGGGSTGRREVAEEGAILLGRRADAPVKRRSN
jgi:hypothetical protein